MTKISQYPEIATPDVDDLLVGTDVENSNATKNFTVQSIIDLATGVITTSENGTMYSTNPVAGVPTVDDSIFFGEYAGQDATAANGSNFFGNNAGQDATNASNSNFFGDGAGYGATNADYSNFFGISAGYLATEASNSNFFGQSAGNSATNASNSNFLGINAGQNSTGNNVNAFGYNAGNSNALSGQTIFSNASLPSYVNRAAAVAAITVLLGGSAGSTYLYYNETTFGIEAVRL